MLYSIALPLHSYVTRFLERYYSVVKSWTVWTRSTSTQRPVPGRIAHWTGAAMMDVVYTPFLEYYTHDELITITCSDVRLNQPSDTVFSLSWGTSRYRGDSLGSNVNVVEKFLRFCGLLEIDKTLLVRSLWTEHLGNVEQPHWLARPRSIIWGGSWLIPGWWRSREYVLNGTHLVNEMSQLIIKSDARSNYRMLSTWSPVHSVFVNKDIELRFLSWLTGPNIHFTLWPKPTGNQT